jgi:nicotinate-nucleotide--dimethylbenzimidazole phosphoribosyltransferase
MLDFIPSIRPTTDAKLEGEIRAHLDELTKPPGSLGRLEEFALRYCLCRRSSSAAIQVMKLFTFAGDHGITEEGITPYPPEVTRQMVLNMATGGAAVSIMCKTAGIEYAVVDVGVKSHFDPVPRLMIRKVREGTRNFLTVPAMTAADCESAVRVGYELAVSSGADLLGAGEMGIGNSSSASALYSILLDVDPTQTVGPGTGSQGALLEKKRAAVRTAVAIHKKEWDGSPFDALRRVGGFELAAICGLALGGAAMGIPVVIDGFIASAGALAALLIVPSARDYLFFSHVSAEPFHREFYAKQSIRPVLDLDMRLGEGTGAVLAMQIIQQSMMCYANMATFHSAGVSKRE